MNRLKALRRSHGFKTLVSCSLSERPCVRERVHALAPCSVPGEVQKLTDLEAKITSGLRGEGIVGLGEKELANLILAAACAGEQAEGGE